LCYGWFKLDFNLLDRWISIFDKFNSSD